MCTKVNIDMPPRLGTDVSLWLSKYFLKKQSKGPLRLLLKVAILCQSASVQNGEMGGESLGTQVGKQP